MMRAAWMVLAAALPLAAQPELLVNAKVDTHHAAQGLDGEFQALVSATPQPAWIAYSVPSTGTAALGCEFVSRDGAWWSNGTVHLEPPGHALILFRVAAGAVERIRALSPDCEIDAGQAPFHWIADVAPAQSVALLAAFATRESPLLAAVSAIAVHGDPAATDALVSLVQSGKDAKVRAQAVRELGHRGGAQAVAAIGAALDKDSDPGLQRAACAALQSLPGGVGIPRLIQLAREARNRELRRQAMTSLQNSHDPRALVFFEEVLAK